MPTTDELERIGCGVEDLVRAGLQQPLLIGQAILHMGWRDTKAEPREFGAFGFGLNNGVDIGDRVSEVGDQLGVIPIGQLHGHVDEASGIWFVWGISHGNQGRILQPQALSQHVARGGWFGTTDKSPAHIGSAECLEEIRTDQQRLIADEATPSVGIAFRVATEIKPTKNVDERIAFWNGRAVSPQQLKTGVPVVVPGSLPFELVDVLRTGRPAAVVADGVLQSAAIASGHIPDDTIDVEQQD